MWTHTTRILSEESGAESGSGGGGGSPTALGDPPGDSETASAAAEGSGQPEGGGGQGESPASLWGRLFDQSTNTLRNGWQDVAREAQLPDAAINYLGREGFNGKGDEILKSALNLANVTGKRVEQLTDGEIDALGDAERRGLMKKLQRIPESPDGYNLDVQAFEAYGLNDESKAELAKAAHEIGVTQAQLEKLAEVNANLAQQGAEAQQASAQEAAAANRQEIQTYFQAKWGDDYSINKTLVEAHVEKVLDLENNPAHRALVNDRVGLELLYNDAKAKALGRGEGAFPSGGEQNQAGRWQDQFEKFKEQHGGGTNWMTGSQEVVEQGNYLAKMAAKEHERLSRQ